MNNRVFELGKLISIVWLCLFAASAMVHAQVDEVSNTNINETASPHWDPVKGEFRTQAVLHQRISEREMLTSRGQVTVPPSVRIVDSRRVDDWYLRQDAAITFYFVKEKMVRVEIGY